MSKQENLSTTLLLIRFRYYRENFIKTMYNTNKERNFHNLTDPKACIVYINFTFMKFVLMVGLKASYIVGENIIATTKIRNNYVTIQSFIFPILRQYPFWYLSFFASFLMASFLKLSLFQLSRQLSLFLALKGDSNKNTITFR